MAQQGAPTHRLARGQLTRAEVRELFDAMAFADQMLARRTGRFVPVSDFYFVTVTWGLTGWRDAAAPDAIRELLQRSRTFLHAAGQPLVWAYNQEWGSDKGLHWHLIIYVPTAALQRKFRGRFRVWLKLPRRDHHAGGGRPVVFEPAFSMDGRRHSSPKWGLLQYLAKDSPDDVRAEFAVPDEWPATGGIVLGKRMAVSLSIGPGARRRASRVDGNVVQFAGALRRAA